MNAYGGHPSDVCGPLGTGVDCLDIHCDCPCHFLDAFPAGERWVQRMRTAATPHELELAHRYMLRALAQDKTAPAGAPRTPPIMC